MREADIAETRAVQGIAPNAALVNCVKESGNAIGTFVDGELILVHGLGELSRDVGIPWALGTDAIEEHGLYLCKYAKKVVDRMLLDYPILMNYVDTRNKVHLRWLKWMGFIFPDQYRNFSGTPFALFYKGRT